MQDQENQSASPRKNMAFHLRLFKKTGPGFSGIRFKIRSLVYILVLGVAVIILLFSYFIVRSTEKKNVSSVLEMMALNNKERLSDYFYRMNLEMRKAGGDPRIQSAFTEFKNAFAGIETDSYQVTSSNTISSISDILTNYYETEFIRPLNRKTNMNFNSSLIPSDAKTRILQFLYIANNENTAGRKSNMVTAGDASVYSQVHALYHPVFKSYLSAIGADDIFLADAENGNILYSFQKNFDFATNISDGPYKNTNIADVFQKAVSTQGSEGLVTSDVDLYLPSTMKPVMFAAMAFNDPEYVLIIQISADRISQLINTISDEKQEYLRSVNSYLAGSDFSILTDDQRIITQKRDMLSKLQRTAIRNEKLNMIDSLNTCIKLSGLSPEIFSKAVLGYREVRNFSDYTGSKVFGIIQPVDLVSEKAYLIIQGSRNNLMNSSSKLLRTGIIILLVTVILLVLITLNFEKKIYGKIGKIIDALKSIISGNPAEIAISNHNDELDDILVNINNVSVRIKKAADYAIELASGNTSDGFGSGSENDLIVKSLNKIKDSLDARIAEDNKRKEEDLVRNWITGGIAKFNDLLRQNNENIELFTDSILKNIIEYLNANQGGFFLVEGDEGQEKTINLIASYAFDRKKFLQKKIKLGEGLLGMCVLEGKYIYLKEIPEDYIEITSGLGHATPRNLLIMPLKHNDEIVGLFELASFNEFKSYEIEFVDKVAESTANTLNSVRLNVRTKELLQESNERAEELSAQEEEMRQNLEELKATQEEMARIKEDEENKEKTRRDQEAKLLLQMKTNNDNLKQKQKELEWEEVMFRALMDNLNDRVTYKDLEGRYLRINKTKIDALGIKSSEEVEGKTDFDVFGGEHHQRAMEEEKKMIQSGVSIKNKEDKIENKDGGTWWASTNRVPLKNGKGETLGVLVITQDITNRKNAQYELELYDKMLTDITSLLPALKYSFDKEGKILSFKGKGLEILGFQEKDLIGKDFFVLYPDAHNIFEMTDVKDGYSFSHKGNNREFRHLIFANQSNYGGYSGIAFETKLLEKGEE